MRTLPPRPEIQYLYAPFARARMTRGEASWAGTLGAPPGPGDVVGSYRIVRFLGAGGMAQVYEAVDSRGNPVAVKVLSPSRLLPEDVKRFTREFQAVSHMSHPNVVQVYETGVHRDVPWIAMEYVDGTDLETEIERWRQQAPQERFELVRRIFRSLCEGLAYVHDQGLVHRDLKPSNILLTADGTPKLSDFGVVKGVGHSGTQLTLAGRLVGTVAFMAPELITDEEVDLRADLYALGAVLYTMCTFRRPIEAQTVGRLPGAAPHRGTSPDYGAFTKSTRPSRTDLPTAASEGQDPSVPDRHVRPAGARAGHRVASEASSRTRRAAPKLESLDRGTSGRCCRRACAVAAHPDRAEPTCSRRWETMSEPMACGWPRPEEKPGRLVPQLLRALGAKASRNTTAEALEQHLAAAPEQPTVLLVDNFESERPRRDWRHREVAPALDDARGAASVVCVHRRRRRGRPRLPSEWRVHRAPQPRA